MRYKLNQAIGGVLGAATVLVLSAPVVTAQRFSDWSPPVNLGSIVNSSAFDG